MKMKPCGAWTATCLIVGAVMSTTLAGQGPTAPRVTFSADIAPIVFERCGGCHHPQGAAPFSLLTYAAARQRATLIGQVTKARVMPPWKSEPGYGEFIGHVHLSDAEVDVMLARARRLDRKPVYPAPRSDYAYPWPMV